MMPYTAHDLLNAMAHAHNDERATEPTRRGHDRGRWRKRPTWPHWLTVTTRRRVPAQASSSC